MYVVIAGKPRPEEIMRGTLEKGLGQTVIKGEKGMSMAQRGSCIFPNPTQIWGMRVINGKPRENGGIINVTDVDYKGEIKPLKWGEAGGTLIETRYLKGFQTRDLSYQDTVLRYKIDDNNEAASEAYFITLQNGDNVFDEKVDEGLIEHLKSHKFNRDSKSKPDDAYQFMFFEKNFEQEESKETKFFDDKFEALSIVKEAGSSFDKLRNLFSIVSAVTDEKPEDEKKYGYLSMLADKRPKEFLGEVVKYKKMVNEAFIKIKSFDAIDLTVDGTIAATVKNKQEVIANEIPGKGDNMLTWLFDNYLEPVAFDAVFKIKKITDKLK